MPILKKVRGGVTRYYVVTKHGGKRRSHGGYDSRAEATRALNALRKAKDDNVYRPPSGELLDDFMADWISRKAATGVHRPRTSAFYQSVIAAYISPVCGSVRLTDLTSAHVQMCVRAMSKGTRVPASTASVHLRFRVLKAALADAVKTDRLVTSPAKNIDLPRIRKTTVDAPTPEQVATILGAAVPPYDTALAILAWTGLRRGEALALTWADIDLEKRQLRVSRALTYDGKTVAFSEPKSDSAKRTVPLADPIVAVLRAHKAAQAERRLQVGPGWQDLDLVIDNGDGGFMHPGRLSHYYGDLTDALGFDTRLHDLRHAAITQMVAAGVDLAKVAAIAGHSNLSFTVAQYAHLRPEHLREAADAMDKAYGGGS